MISHIPKEEGSYSKWVTLLGVVGLAHTLARGRHVNVTYSYVDYVPRYYK